jgi:hypothetical protein
MRAINNHDLLTNHSHRRSELPAASVCFPKGSAGQPTEIHASNNLSITCAESDSRAASHISKKGSAACSHLSVDRSQFPSFAAFCSYSHWMPLAVLSHPIHRPSRETAHPKRSPRAHGEHFATRHPSLNHQPGHHLQKSAPQTLPSRERLPAPHHQPASGEKFQPLNPQGRCFSPPRPAD